MKMQVTEKVCAEFCTEYTVNLIEYNYTSERLLFQQKSANLSVSGFF